MKTKIQIALILAFAMLPEIDLRAQEPPAHMRDTNFTFLMFKDSVYLYEMDEIEVRSKLSRKQKRNIHKYNKLERKVKKVYPYSLIVRDRVLELEQELGKIPKKKDQKKKVKQVEEKLFAEFESVIWKMSLSEGKILVKLVDRELNKSSFQVIKEFRGSFQAYFWQSLALLFGNNLAVDYDAEQDVEDRMIENIIQRIECGELKPDPPKNKK